MKEFLYWLPRVLSVIMVIFVSLFALDVFDMSGAWYSLLGAFLIHLIPTYFLIAATIIAWRRPKIGGWFFIVIGIILLIRFHALPSLPVTLPPIIIGLLFVLQAVYFKRKNIIK